VNVKEVKDQFDGLSERNLKKVRAYEGVRKSRKTSSNSWTVESGTAPKYHEGLTQLYSRSSASCLLTLEWLA
jgi:hypothetical protein